MWILVQGPKARKIWPQEDGVLKKCGIVKLLNRYWDLTCNLSGCDNVHCGCLLSNCNTPYSFLEASGSTSQVSFT